MKDYRVTIKVRNNRILKAIEETGEKLGGKWCDKHGLPYTMVNSLVNMSTSPLGKDFALKEWVVHLCDVLNKTPEDLFSNDQIYPLEQNFSELEMSYEQVIQLSNEKTATYLPDFSVIENKQDETIVADRIATLKPRMQKVIRHRFFDGLTPEKTGGEMGVSAERVRQLERRALRILRHPENTNLLKQCNIMG